MVQVFKKMHMKFLSGPFNFQNLNLPSTPRIMIKVNIRLGSTHLEERGEGGWECVCLTAIPGEQGRT